jgi:hypothetical protein
MAPLTTGGILFGRDLLYGALALIVVILTKPRQTAAQSA